MRYLVIVPLLALLVACSGQQQEAPAVDTGSSAAAAANAPATSAVAALPGGVDFDIPSQLRSDKIYKTKAGATRRRLVYELLEATPDQSQAAVTDMMARAGYKAGEVKLGKSGKASIKYKKKKSSSITATFYPRLAKKPANPDAKSMVAFSWQTKKAPRKKTPASS